MKIFGRKNPATETTKAGNCPGCGCQLTDPTWRNCPRCRAEIASCSGCGGCGACGK